MRCRPHASVAVAAWTLACGPERIAVGGSETETGTLETSTDTGAEECPPEPFPLPIPCVLDGGCSHLYIEYGPYDAETAVCILEALRDREIGHYSFERYTGYTYDNYSFQILDDTHVQWTRWGFADDHPLCSWSTGLSLLRAPEDYEECLALPPGDEQASCLHQFLGAMVPLDAAVCPAP